MRFVPFIFNVMYCKKLLMANNIFLSTREKEEAYGSKYMYLTTMLQSRVKLPLASYVIHKEKQIWCFYFSQDLYHLKETYSPPTTWSASVGHLEILVSYTSYMLRFQFPWRKTSQKPSVVYTTCLKGKWYSRTRLAQIDKHVSIIIGLGA